MLPLHVDDSLRLFEYTRQNILTLNESIKNRLIKYIIKESILKYFGTACTLILNLS